ncbi:uncharacterized protein LOC142817333 [Rhipicephalus microplus]|uniref:uncharacterized protein LOC142817333 n=1 Tax=Rhipicephalus microplus TaxID=6941 RepID=UPI003F6B87B0
MNCLVGATDGQYGSAAAPAASAVGHSHGVLRAGNKPPPPNGASLENGLGCGHSGGTGDRNIMDSNRRCSRRTAAASLQHSPQHSRQRHVLSSEPAPSHDP